MSRTRVVKGNYTKVSQGNHLMFADGNIITTASEEVNQLGKDSGVKHGSPNRLANNEEKDFNISFSLNKDEQTMVPLGVLNFKNEYENPYFAFNYALSLSNIETLDFEIKDADGNIIYLITNLEPIVIMARKVPHLHKQIPALLPEYPVKTWDFANVFKQYTLGPPDYTSIGSYIIYWDGFDNDDIYDSSRFNNKKLTAKITATKSGKQKSLEAEFSTNYHGVHWVDVKINRSKKIIDATLRIGLTDGGAEGLECYDESITRRTDDVPQKFCPWDKIPKSEIRAGQPIIKTRTRAFTDLAKLAIDGLNYHWGRNKNHFIAKDLKINGESFEFCMNALQTEKNAIGAMELIYNTNGKWMRSGNPGSIKDIMTAVGNVVSRQAICYNVGYINYSNGWGYSPETSQDEVFKETSAHEIGHEILKKYGGTFYSYGHKGSTNSVFQYKYDDAPEIPLTGEIDLMPYLSNNALGGEDKQLNYYKRKVGSEKDVLGLIWLSKIEIL
ncbi:hypothetical protein G6M26_06990 [Agrobacterium tumefaciens]|nr:hypothetical protein [Agrobacterium tumefaciens]NTE18264.1 hypothetical protein [Agrobacterium tumefaciens]